jgi:hypothetical protein
MAVPLASTRFFQIPELVDFVLGQLGKKSLLRVRCVNRLFNFRIEQVTTLQEKLYLAPLRCAVLNNWSDKDILRRDVEFAKLTNFAKLNSFLYKLKVTDDRKLTKGKRRSVIDKLPNNHTLMVSADTKLWWEKQGLCFFLFVPQGLKPENDTITPSWRNMLLTQPAVTHVSVFMPCKSAFVVGKPVSLKIREDLVTNEKGVKISDVLDMIVEYADTDYLKMAPYAVQVINPHCDDSSFRQYEERMREFWHGWRKELGLGRADQNYEVRATSRVT